MGSPTSTSSTALPVAAAISLACATFGAVERAHANESAIKTSHSSEQRFGRHDLDRLESFAHFLARNESWLPPLHERSRVFDLLTIEGILSSVTPHPLEQAALHHLASTDASTLHFRILSTRVRSKDSFSLRDMFGEAPQQIPPESLRLTGPLSKEDTRHYGQALGFCHLISGHLSIASTNGTMSQEEVYLRTLPIEQHSRILQTVGALKVTQHSRHTTLAARMGHAYLAKIANTITETDRANVPQLEGIEHYTSNVWAYRMLVVGSAATAFGLYHTARKRLTSSEIPRREAL